MKYLFFVFVNTLAIHVFTQNNTNQLKFQLGIGPSYSFFKDPNFSGIWNSINPNFDEQSLLNAAYHTSMGDYYSTNSKFNIGFQGIKKVKESRFYFAPRVDFSYGEGLQSFQYWQKIESYVYDTLTSSATGEKFYLDSSIISGKDFMFRSKSVALKLALNFEYDLGKRLSIYSGVEFGFAQNFSIKQENNSYTFVNKRYFEEGLYFSPYEYVSSESIEYNKYNAMYKPLKVNQIIFGIPIGLKFRLSKKDTFLSRFLISYEYNLNQSLFKINSKLSDKQEIAKFQQTQHSHLFRLLYEF
jgi:hypothetical protein